MTLPHICFVAGNIYPVLASNTNVEFVGGGEVQQTIVMRALKRKGHQVSVLTRDFGQGAEVDCDGINVYRIPKIGGRGLKGLRFIHPLLTDVVACLRQINPDLVYQRVASSYTLAVGWYARHHRKRFIFAAGSDLDFRRSDNPSLSAKDKFLFHLALNRFADMVFVQNEDQGRLLTANFGKTGYLIPNCYEEPTAGLASASGPVLWVGTIKPIKQPEYFLELARRFPERQFRMIGGAGVTPDAQDYLARIRRAASDIANLELCGHVPFSEVGRNFDGASVFVNSSTSEGFPNTFLQAWIRGMPSLSFVRPETAPGKCGTLACSDIEEMAERLRLLTSSASAWETASIACRAYFLEHHSVDRVIHRYEEIFNRVVQSGAGCRV